MDGRLSCSSGLWRIPYFALRIYAVFYEVFFVICSLASFKMSRLSWVIAFPSFIAAILILSSLLQEVGDVKDVECRRFRCCGHVSDLINWSGPYLSWVFLFRSNLCMSWRIYICCQGFQILRFRLFLLLRDLWFSMPGKFVRSVWLVAHWWTVPSQYCVDVLYSRSFIPKWGFARHRWFWGSASWILA